MKKLMLLAVVLTGMVLVQGCKEEKSIPKQETKEDTHQRLEYQKEIDAANARLRADEEFQREIARKQKEANDRVKEQQEKPQHDKLDAFTIAQDFVESNLRCPRTAKWPWISYSKVTVHLGDGKYQISSYLDAQNGFGAMVRIHFVCIVQHTGGSNWRLVKLVM